MNRNQATSASPLRVSGGMRMGRIALLVYLLAIPTLMAFASELTITKTLPEPELTLTNGFSRFLPGTAFLHGAPGEPELPLVSHSILLPPGEEITAVQVINLEWEELTGEFLLFPAQPPIPYSKRDGIVFTEPDGEAYSSNIPTPSSPLAMSRTDFLRGHGVGTINICVAQYTPAQKRLKFLRSYDLVVQTASTARAQEAYGTLFKRDARTIQRLQDLVENPSLLAAYPSVQTVDELGCKYLIITAEDLADYFQPLAQHKTMRNLPAEIVLVEDIAAQYPGVDLPEKIRNCVKAYYLSEPLEYVLLAGDDEYVPHRGLYASLGGEVDLDVPADLYFSNLDGNWNTDGDAYWGESNEADLYAEVAIGRMPSDSPSEAQNVVNKTILYENTPVVADLEKALMLGEDLGWISWGSWYKEEIRLGSSSWGYSTAAIAGNFSVETLYDAPGYSWSAGTGLVPRLNGGVHLVNHLGHAINGYVMKIGSSSVTDEILTNDGVNHNFYIAYSQGCYNGAFDNRTTGTSYTTDAITEKFAGIQHGAVAFLCNSRYGWGNYYDTDGPSQYYDREFFDAIFSEGIHNLGWINADSKEDNVSRLANATLWVYYEMNLIGDPALDVWTASPQNLSANYPDTLAMTTTQVSVFTSVPNVTVSLTFDNGQILGATQANAQGIAIVTIENPIPYPGDVTLYVSEHNYLPFSAVIPAVPESGAYVRMLDVSFSDAIGGDNDGLADLGETLYFTASFRNYGVDPTAGLTVSLSCEDYCVDLIESSVVQPSGYALAAGDTIALQETFAVRILPSVDDNQELSFQFSISEAGGGNWTEDFQIIAHAPRLELLSWTLDDGNDDLLQPGE
ncbi:MAG: C25 family cysteine peptidase, partial [bacterium]